MAINRRDREISYLHWYQAREGVPLEVQPKSAPSVASLHVLYRVSLRAFSASKMEDHPKRLLDGSQPPDGDAI